MLAGEEEVDGKTNSFSAGMSGDDFLVNLESHTEANRKEVKGIEALGARVDVNQKINITINGRGKISIGIGHGTYPSVVMSIAGVASPLYQYSAQSFLYSHGVNLLSDRNYEGQAMMQQTASDIQNANNRSINQAVFRGFTSAPFPLRSSLSWFMYK